LCPNDTVLTVIYLHFSQPAQLVRCPVVIPCIDYSVIYRCC